MERVLSIGASLDNIESIKIAKKMGYEVIAIDGNSNSEAFKFADIPLVIDIKNENQIIEIARDYCVKAVLPSPIGRYLTTIGAVNDSLGLRGISKVAALNCVDKVKFNNILINNNINCAKQGVANDKSEIIKKIKNIGLPCILKPRFGSGSKAVRVIENNEDIFKIVEEHYSDRGNDETLIEELIKGIEYGIDASIENGKIKLVLVREKVITEFPYRQEVGYICPAKLSEKSELKIQEKLNEVCKLIKMDNCLIHADMLINDDGFFIIEMSGRPSGYFLSNKVVPFVTGVKFIYEGIKLVLGKECNFDIKYIKPTSILFLDFIKGKVIDIKSNSELEEEEFIYESNIKFKEGDILKEITCGKDIYDRGYILIKGRDIIEAENRLRALIKTKY